MFHYKILKCIPLLLHLYSVHGVRFHNPPSLPPDVFRLSEKHSRLVFEKLKDKEERDFLEDIERSDFGNQVSVLKDIRQKIGDKFEEFRNDIAHESPIKKLLDKYNNNNKKQGLKRILVTRVVPHGFKSPNYEYDYNFKTLYRPLARVHKRRRIKEDSGTRTEELPFNFNDNHQFRRNAKLRTYQNVDADENRVFVKRIGNNFQLDKNFNDDHLLDPFQLESDELDKTDGNERHANQIAFRDETRSGKKKENKVFLRMSGNTFDRDTEYSDHYLLDPFKLETDIQDKKSRENRPHQHTKDVTAEMLGIVKRIQSLTRTVKSPKLKKKVYDKVLEILQDVKGLRSGNWNGIAINVGNGGSDCKTEECDADGDPVVEPADSYSVANKPFLHQFNYWTYLKGVYENQCPGHQVKIGNVCSWTPPH